jgi:hypothetical protein
MANVDFQNIADLKREAVDSMVRTYFENNAPGYNAFRKASETHELTDKGYRIGMWTNRPGGHTAFVPSASDFNAAVPPQSQSMYIFPTHYALPMVFQGNVLRAFERDRQNNLQSLLNILKLYTDTATKRIEMMFYGDGTGSLAYSSSTLSSTGPGQTLNCTTAAAATPGQTKGATRLELNQSYNAVNTSTGAVRGTFTVTATGASSCTINLLSGTISSGDPITDINSYNKYMRGLGWLISDQSRTLQGLSTSAFPDLNSPMVDLAGAALTPAAFENVKASLNTRNNDQIAENALVCFMTFGQHSVLRKQGYSLGYYVRSGSVGEGDTVKGVAKQYQDGDTTFVLAADCDDDRAYLVKMDSVKMFEEMPFGEYQFDAQSWRMLLGTNSAGSDNYQRAIGLCANPGITYPRACAFVKRASLSGVVTQVTSF